MKRILIAILSLSLIMCSLVGCSSKDKNNDDDNKRIEVDSSDVKRSNKNNNRIVVIDAGHQEAPINELEPIGPNSDKKKPKLASGATGVSTNIPEYQLTLDVSLKLRDELIKRGYDVKMIRENNNFPKSNRERAIIANSYGKNKDSIFLRIHANSISDSNVTGALTMGPSDDNPYMSKENIEKSKLLSVDVIEEMTKSTDSMDKGIILTNEMSGINWCEIPVTIVEMGFLSNPEEDRLMNSKDYQKLISSGIANGVDKYFNN
ncbi:N-acetylmuramoyl-L-alanine amidase [Peptostreptococcus faecalis]|uniref:N-acetylmuramoyl-L-alanine amidase n=1 Tax=Peptostreptococcus faecalis TaxID=2045015 RepID=UPI000C7AD030|nr:N-acetylmuramoyl-L-alanine amidase [Peptostreptococcus faecalis]